MTVIRKEDITYNPRTTRLFPNVIMKNEIGFQFITSANLLAIMCNNLKEVIGEVIDCSEEPVQIILSGYSEQVLLCLEDFLHEGTVNVTGSSPEDCETFCSDLRHQFEEVFGISVPQDFWELESRDFLVKEENIGDGSELKSVDCSLVKNEPPVNSPETPLFGSIIIPTKVVEVPNGFDHVEKDPLDILENGQLNHLRSGGKPEIEKQIVVSGDVTFEVRPDKSRSRVNFPCPICSVVFKLRKQWCSHIKKIHPEEADKYLKEQQCPHCKRTFGSISWLEMHLRSKSSKCQKEFICDKCGKVFKNYVAVQDHIQNVHGDDSSTCKVCGKHFKNIRRVQKHFNREHKYVLQCEHCELQFKNNQTLNQHLLTVHTANDDKPFICKICGKGFGRKPTYIEHCRTHTAEKPYKCRFCHYACASSSNISKHEKQIHPDLYTSKRKQQAIEEKVISR